MRTELRLAYLTPGERFDASEVVHTYELAPLGDGGTLGEVAPTLPPAAGLAASYRHYFPYSTMPAPG